MTGPAKRAPPERERWPDPHGREGGNPAADESSESSTAKVLGHDTPANFVPVNSADNWLYLILCIGMIALAVLLSRGTTPRRSPTASA